MNSRAQKVASCDTRSAPRARVAMAVDSAVSPRRTSFLPGRTTPGVLRGVGPGPEPSAGANPAAAPSPGPSRAASALRSRNTYPQQGTRCSSCAAAADAPPGSSSVQVSPTCTTRSSPASYAACQSARRCGASAGA